MKTSSRRRGTIRPPSVSSSDEEPNTLSRSLLGGEPTEPTEQLDPFNDEHLWGTSTQRTEPEFEHEPEPEQRTPATIDTQDSFETAPELSEPVEHFFGAVLKQKPKSPTSFNESEMDLNTMNTETEQNLGSMNAVAVHPVCSLFVDSLCNHSVFGIDVDLRQ